MPNCENVEAPINVHGIGRSGTTLLQNILGAAGDMQVCNEMAGLVFCCFRGAEVAIGSNDREALALNADSRGAAVHAALCATMPSAKPRWCQKLGGLPKYISWNMTDRDDRGYAAEPFPFPYQWFWRALRNIFPRSKDVLIVRDYRDAITSRHYHTGWHPDDIAADVTVYFNLMAHPASKIDCVVRYEDLVARPAETVEKFLEALGVGVSRLPMEALMWHGAPSPGDSLAMARRRGFSWREKHDSIITDGIRRMVKPAIRRLEEKFNIELETF